jgi:hypothetical protein
LLATTRAGQKHGGLKQYKIRGLGGSGVVLGSTDGLVGLQLASGAAGDNFTYQIFTNALNFRIKKATKLPSCLRLAENDGFP